MKKLIFVISLMFVILVFGVLVYGDNNRLQANESDIETLERDINSKYRHLMGEYDYQNYDFNNLMSYAAYTLIDDERFKVSNETDPLNKIKGEWEYYKIPAAYMDNILVNIFNATPNHSYMQDYGDWCVGYYYNDYYYYQFEGLGGSGIEYKITEYSMQSDGKYHIKGIEIVPTYEETYNFYIIADLKNLNNNRTWTFYNVSFDALFYDESVANVVTFQIDGYKIRFPSNDANPTIINNRVYVPIRKTCEYLGIRVTYDNIEGRMFFYGEDRIVSHIKNSSTVYVDGEPIYFDVPSINVEGRTLMPIRMLAESVGMTVEWDDITRTVNIVRG